MGNFTFHDGWTIREAEYVPEEAVARATVFALANGYMGLRGAGEEVSPTIEGLKGCYVNGIYDTPEGKLTEREFPNLPDWTLIELSVDGEPFGLDLGTLLDYRRELALRNGTVRREVHWRSPGGKAVRIESERFLSMERPHVGAIRYRVEALDDCSITLATSIDANVTNRWARHVKSARTEARGHVQYLEIETFDPGYRIGVATLSGARVEGEAGDRSHGTVRGDGRVGETRRFTLKAGESATIVKFAAVFDNRFSDGDLRELCEDEVDKAFQLGYRDLKAEHSARWAELWAASDVVIEGDDDAQMGIRFSLFHLLATAPYHSNEISIPARGLQGQDYYGSIFWDCEIFVFPLFAATQPDVARNLVGYRIATLEGAQRKAKSLGYTGAYYAWQSQETGDEQCDLYVFTNPLTGEKIRSYFADEQIHISADVAHAAWQYHDATGDDSIWADGAAEVVFEVARFLASRVTRRDGQDHLESVLGPDEYHERVDDNAFTNAMAAEALRRAAQLGSRLDADPTEVESWREIAGRLFVPQPDPQTGLIEQFAGYLALRDEPVAETMARLAHPDLHRGGPLGPFQETQNIKQADVVMLLYLHRDRYDVATKRANWAYYEPRTAHDSSLSPMAYSLVAADVGMVDWAYKYFIYTSHIDLEAYGPHWNLGVHTASLGGAWLAVVQGFCQLMLREQGPTILQWPRLPPGWSKVEFAFAWHGVRVECRVEPSLLKLTSRGERDIAVWLPDGEAVLPAGGILERRF